MRFLAVDYGTRRVGLAVCDELDVAVALFGDPDTDVTAGVSHRGLPACTRSGRTGRGGSSQG